MNHHILLAEEAITHGMIAGTLDHPRLATALRSLDRGTHVVPLTDLCVAMRRLADEQMSTGEAVCLALDHLHVTIRCHIAELQFLAIGFYRTIWRLLVRLDPLITLDEIRSFLSSDATRLCFGFSFDLPSSLPFPAHQRARIRAHLTRLFQAPDSDQTWSEHSPLPLAPSLTTVPDRHLSTGANAIRNAFFTHALDYLASTAPPNLKHDALIIDLLRGAATQPRRLPFLNGLTPAQAHFRIVQLALGLIGLHQVETMDETTRLLPDAFLTAAVTCLLTPVVNLRGWLRLHRDHVRIPVVRMMPGGDPLVLPPSAIFTIPAHAHAVRRRSPAMA